MTITICSSLQGMTFSIIFYHLVHLVMQVISVINSFTVRLKTMATILGDSSAFSQATHLSILRTLTSEVFWRESSGRFSSFFFVHEKCCESTWSWELWLICCCKMLSFISSKHLCDVNLFRSELTEQQVSPLLAIPLPTPEKLHLGKQWMKSRLLGKFISA